MKRSSRDAEAPLLLLVLFAALFVCSATGGSAQVLQLPEPVDPPVIDGPTHASEIVATLTDEIRHFGTIERGAGESQRIIIRASINLRILAAELISQGDAAGAAGSTSVLTGIRLVNGRESIDALLIELHQTLDRKLKTGGDAAVETRALEAVSRFNDAAVDRAQTVRTIDAAELDANLPIILAPLEECILLVQAYEPISHWPSRASVEAPPSATTAGPGRIPRGGPPAGSIEQLAHRIERAAIDEDLRELLVRIHDQLGGRGRPAVFRPRMARLRPRLTGMLDFIDAVTAAEWLDAALANALLEQLRQAAELLADPESAPEAEVALDRLGAVQVAVNRLTTLDAWDVDVEQIGEALHRAAGSHEDVPAERIEQLGVVLQRMIAFRELDRGELPRSLRPLAVRLEEAYRAAERALVDEIETLMIDPRPLADPPFSTLIADQAQYLKDIQRVHRLPEWTDTIAGMNARVSDAFASHMRKTSHGLLDSNRRPDAVETMDEFERQLLLFLPLPYEVELSANDSEAIVATGGLHAELLDLIYEIRRQWAEQWSRGEAGGEAVERLLMLHRLTQTMADGVEVIRAHGNTGLLNRWAMWEMPRALVVRTVTDVPNRLKLATAAATQGDWATLSAQLDRIDREAPLARLVGRLSLLMTGALVALPDGAPCVIGQSMYAPRSDAWMLSRRQEIAELCRYAIEADAAWFEQREEDARKLQAFVNARADELLDELDGPLP